MKVTAYAIDNFKKIPKKQGLYAFYLDLTSPVKIGLLGRGPFNECKLEVSKKILIKRVKKLINLVRSSTLEGHIREVGRGEHILRTYNLDATETYTGNLVNFLESIPLDSLLEYSQMTQKLSLFSQPIYVGITKDQTLYGRYTQHKNNYENSSDNSKFGVRLKNSGFDWEDLVFGCVAFDVSSENSNILNILEKQLQAVANPPLSIKKEIYNFTKSGSFGKFFAGSSFPVEYVQTSFAADELEDLTFARDIRPPDSLDFDLLIQRDIDEDRVRKEIEPYLNPKTTESEKRTKVVFFPPLLVAVIPIEEHKMRYYYPDEDSQTDDEYLNREWPGLFKVTYFLDDGSQSYPLDAVLEGKQEKINIAFDQADINIRLAKGGQLGAKLVVIDGQHRLFALKNLLKKNRPLIEDLIVPVCILFSPDSTLFKKQSYKLEIPTVPEVFRHLFVDVNKTMEAVGGHFHILLSDDSMGSLACRKFCDQVLKDEDYGTEGLAVIEWNTKSAKESTRIQRPYSLTSIGVIDQAMKESLGESRYLTSYLLNLASKEPELYPADDEYDHPTVDWRTFSLTQKKIIDGQIKDILVPALKKIFFETGEFLNSYSIFKEELSVLIKESESDDTDVALEARGALNQIIEYLPIGSSAAHDKQKARYRKFEISVKERKEAEISPIISYSIFQRGVFSTWGELLKFSRQKSAEVDKVTNALIYLLNAALKGKGVFFKFDKEYMQHAVFETNKIKPKNETRKAISNLILAHLGTEENAKEVIKTLDLTEGGIEKEIIELGQNKASEYIKHYEKERKRSFRNFYRVDFSIDKDDREELSLAEEEQKKHLREVRDGARSKENVSTRFDELMNDYVKKDVELASKALKGALSYSTDIIGSEANLDDNGS